MKIAQEVMKTAAQIAKIKAPITQDSEIQLIDTKQSIPYKKPFHKISRKGSYFSYWAFLLTASSSPSRVHFIMIIIRQARGRFIGIKMVVKYFRYFINRLLI